MVIETGQKFVLTDQWFYNPGGKSKMPIRRGQVGMFGTLTKVDYKPNRIAGKDEFEAILSDGSKIFFFDGKTDKGAFTSKFNEITLPVGKWMGVQPDA